MDSHNPNSVKEKERVELKNKWERLQNEMINAKYF